MKGGDKHGNSRQLSIAVHYAAFMKRERRYDKDEIQDNAGEVNR